MVNYLAHAYLSFDDPEVLTGNMISDFVKGKKKYDYPPFILAGIDLHRSIDNFTDFHPVTKEAKLIFKPYYGLYASAFMDVVYDHFLGLQLAEAGEAHFLNFTTGIYQKLDLFESLFPEKFRAMYPSMKKHNWLYNYQFDWGIARSFEGLVYRAAYLSESKMAYSLFKEHYQMLQIRYDQFFPQLKQHAREILRQFSGKT